MKQSIIKYNQFDLDNYLKKLSIVGALSVLFSDSDVPFLHYRAVENIYCSAFKAENLARSDVSADAKLRKYGIGLKTFLERNCNNFEKIAEFNEQQKFYSNLYGMDKVRAISDLRNRRLWFTQNAYNIDTLLYHCVLRNKSGFYLFEEDMHYIDVDNITITSKPTSKNIVFNDQKCEYKFDVSKSTLYKRFVTNEYFGQVDVKILADPLLELEKLDISGMKTEISQYIIIPLYSYDGNNKVVFPKSGLNIWNAGGRIRHQDEVYIPFPIELRRIFEGFFPNRDTPFEVLLPNGETISMKVSQDGGKALTSNPNKALGKWILRDVLRLDYGELVTYDYLLSFGVDAIIFEKIGEQYKLDFVEIGQYEKFYYEHVIPDME